MARLSDSDARVLREMREAIAQMQELLRNSRGLNLGGGLSIPPPSNPRRDMPSRNKNELIPVALTQTGGSAGNKTTQCSFTYTVKDINSVETLGTAIAMAGNGNRVVNATMTAGTYGLAYRGYDGVIKLIWADERFSQTNCT